MTSHPPLLSALGLRGVEFRTRLGLPPMSQYSAAPGVHAATSWHRHHYAARALGLGTVIVEATAVSAQALVTPHDLGLWTATQQQSLAAVARAIAEGGAVPALQLSHSGRKGSRTRPWEGDTWLRPGQGGWEVIGPSAAAFAEGYPQRRSVSGVGWWSSRCSVR